MTTGWRIRLGGIAILFTGMGLWFLYDGIMGYPGQQEIYDEFQHFKVDHAAEDDWQDQWDKIAESKSYPVIEWTDPESKWYENMQHSSGAIMLQTGLGLGVLPFAILFGFYWIKSAKRFTEADDDGVHNESGNRAKWNQFVKFDKRRWPKKGIAILHFLDDADAAAKAREALLNAGDESQAADGTVATKTITLDDWKYEPASTKQIVMAIESHIDEKLIIGDITEAERDAQKKAAAENANSDATAESEAASTAEIDDSADNVEEDSPERVA